MNDELVIKPWERYLTVQLIFALSLMISEDSRFGVVGKTLDS